MRYNTKQSEQSTKSRFEIPNTKDGFRYHLSEEDNALCKEYIEQLQVIDTYKRINIPPITKRKVIFSEVTLSDHDKAPQLKLSANRMQVVGERGYSMARSTHGINRGKWYYEIYIDKMPPGTAARVGWGLAFANLQAPLGYDEFGYSYRSRFGTKFHQAIGVSFDKNGGYKEGDIIGCLIDLPYGNDSNITMPKHLPVSIKSNSYVISGHRKHTSHGYRVLEEKDKVPTKSEMRILPGSKISFYKNGNFVGVAFEDIIEGTYYPTVSLYKECCIEVNFGPTFKYPPEEAKNDIDKIYVGYQDFQQVPDIVIVDNLLADIKFMIDNKEDNDEKVKQCIATLKTAKP